MYVRDLTELYQNNNQLTRYLIIISFIIEMILSAILLLFLRKLTKPIHILQHATRTIASGVYKDRIQLKGHDELSDLAYSFNQMAVSIEDQMEELAQNARDKQRLIDNLAHELRTPLTAIRGYAEYLQGASTHERNRIKATQHMIQEIDRIKNLAFKLLDLSLTRNSSIELQDIELMTLLLQVEAVAAASLKGRIIRLVIHNDSGQAKLRCDVSLIQSLLLNLIDNAAKASPMGTEIVIKAYLNPMIIIEVQDQGIGIEEGQLKFVFEPFYRIDTARSSTLGGAGLGLTLCREIANLHGANLEILSELGQGTTARLSFTTPLQPIENLEIPHRV
ncbi:signal transduction histidine kinase [Paenibacillus shirakamiensis]|uniref:histidine kinase n=1 Tax=Paenibacillus shirakamiensis TaxID=1265935 RepID=A0ABS4JEJ3_9BACL|nr:HAMP domain-containing sensor histidine kinase [Paenibacillus shirakamiensis]MBP2000135.1 signal transduction histidine kinase [Paenibacillus shirakamiensis]